MTIFSKTAHNLGWMTSEQALEYLTKLTQDSTGRELKPYELDNKLTKGKITYLEDENGNGLALLDCMT